MFKNYEKNSVLRLYPYLSFPRVQSTGNKSLGIFCHVQKQRYETMRIKVLVGGCILLFTLFYNLSINHFFRYRSFRTIFYAFTILANTCTCLCTIWIHSVPFLKKYLFLIYDLTLACWTKFQLKIFQCDQHATSFPHFYIFFLHEHTSTFIFIILTKFANAIIVSFLSVILRLNKF